MVNLFCVLRTCPQKLLKALQRTPYSETEYQNAFVETLDPVERARRLIVRAHAGFHSRVVFGDKCTWRVFASHDGNAAKSFQSYVRSLPAIIARLRNVTISKRPALKVIQDCDSADTLIYADPPYVSKTRKSDAKYRFEMVDEEHKALLDALLSAKSMIVLSGYPSDLYDKMLKKWQRIVIPTRVFSVATQTVAEEILWINPQAQKRLKQKT